MMTINRCSVSNRVPCTQPSTQNERRRPDTTACCSTERMHGKKLHTDQQRNAPGTWRSNARVRGDLGPLGAGLLGLRML